MSGQLVPAEVTLVTVAGVYAALRGAWRAQMGADAPRAAILVLLSQWCLETGRGKSCRAYNLGNAKHRDGDGRDWCQFSCSEVDAHGVEHFFHPPDPTTSFRAFPSLDAGAADYLEMVRDNFPKTWPFVVGGDPDAYSRAAHASGYYTANVDTYTRSLAAIFHELDREVPPDATAPVALAGFASPPLEDLGQPTAPSDLPPATA